MQVTTLASTGNGCGNDDWACEVAVWQRRRWLGLVRPGLHGQEGEEQRQQRAGRPLAVARGKGRKPATSEVTVWVAAGVVSQCAGLRLIAAYMAKMKKKS